jgi:phage terminase small subunit
MALTGKESRFVDEYLVDYNKTQAAIRAGYNKKNAKQQGHQIMQRPDVLEAINKGQAELAQRTQITQEVVLQRYWDIATANVNDVVQFRRTCCRYCYGRKFQYQWTAGEYKRAQDDARNYKKEAPELQGGLGFDARKDPNQNCPECFGSGHGHMHVHDTRKLTGPAALLYVGVKQSKEGLEVKTLDPLEALKLVGQHLGMAKAKLEHSGPNGGPIKTQREMTDAELQAIIDGLENPK